jgi:hypothetical protein
MPSGLPPCQEEGCYFRLAEQQLSGTPHLADKHVVVFIPKSSSRLPAKATFLPLPRGSAAEEPVRSEGVAWTSGAVVIMVMVVIVVMEVYPICVHSP